MDRVLQPLGDPVHSKCDKDDQADDFALATAANTFATRGIVAGMILDVDSYQRYRVPSAECCGEHASDEGNGVDVAVAFGDVDAGFEHEGREGDARDPGDEADSSFQCQRLDCSIV